MSTELKEKIKDHYNKISSHYKELWGENIHHGYWIKGDESKEVAQEQLMHELAKVGGVFKGAKIVDVGCGVGGGSMYLTKNYNASVTGISISSEQIKMATEAENDGKTDFIWIVEAMSHFPHKKQFLMHANRLLKKNGRIIIADWFKCEHLTPEQEAGDLKSIEEGMLLPELNTMFDYIAFLHERGFKVEYVRDISQQTAKTWDICLGLITNPSFWSLAWQHGSEFVSFLKSFKSMRNAFGTTFRYGIIVAEKIVDAQQA